MPVRKPGASGYRGVTFHKASNKFRARIRIEGKQKQLGAYSTALAASQAYEAARQQRAPAEPEPLCDCHTREHQVCDICQGGSTITSEPAPEKSTWTGFRGVSLNPYSNMYVARIRIGGVSHYLGSHNTAILAAKAYDRGALQYRGPNALVNFPLKPAGQADANR